MKLIEIKPSTRKDKKLMAVFDVNGKKITTHFGSKGMRDYTLINNPKSEFYIKSVKEREKVKDAYIRRHQKREDWMKPMTAGALSKWILWTEPNLNSAIRNYRRKFSL